MGWHLNELCDKYHIQMVQSSPYNPQSNGQVESFNKILKQMLRKTVSESQKDWHERIHEALWSYRTSTRRSTGTTPFNLVYGAEAVLPIEIELPSLRITAAAELTPEDERYVKNRIAALENLKKKGRMLRRS